jgi:hypothetical protein
MALQSYWIELKKVVRIKQLEKELTDLSMKCGAISSITMESANLAQITTSSAILIEALKNNKDYKIKRVISE